MIRNSLPRLSALAAIAATVIPASAQAWWRGGVFVGLPPVVIGPPPVAYPGPYYYPPPYYGPAPYAAPYPPPAAPAPQAEQTPAPQFSQANTPFGSTCYAGVYVCAAPPETHVGTGCACAGLGAPSYGVVQ